MSPQPSLAERYNRNLRSVLLACHAESQNTWDVNLDWLQLAFNTASYESRGKTPFEIIFPFRAGVPLLNNWGIQHLLPAKCSARKLRLVWDDVRRSLRRSHQKMEKRHKKGRLVNEYRVDDVAWLKTHNISQAPREFQLKYRILGVDRGLFLDACYGLVYGPSRSISSRAGSSFSVESLTYSRIAVMELIILSVVRGHCLRSFYIYLCTCVAILYTGRITHLGLEHFTVFLGGCASDVVGRKLCICSHVMSFLSCYIRTRSAGATKPSDDIWPSVFLLSALWYLLVQLMADLDEAR
jgi:hypothetical protein